MKRNLATAAFVLASLAVYVGGYYQLANLVWKVPGNSGPPVVAQYRAGGALAELIFRPMELFDRHLRPEWWAGDPAIPPWQSSTRSP